MPKKRKINSKNISKPHITIFKLLLSLLLICFIGAAYFLALISTKPKSFPFVTQKIEYYVNNNLPYGGNLTINKTFIGFSKFHKIKITIDDIRLKLESKEELLFPKIEIEFSIFNLMLLRYVPSKIKIINPTIEINNISKEIQSISINGLDNKQTANWHQDLEKLWEIFSSIKSGSTPIKNFEVENAKIILNNQSGTHNIRLKNAKIKTSFKSGYLNINTNSKISVNKNDLDMNLNGNCQFKKSEGLHCDTRFC